VLHVAGTFENLDIFRAPEQFIGSIFSSLYTLENNIHTLSNLRTLSFEGVGSGLEIYYLARFLYSRSDKLRSFRLVWKWEPCLSGTCFAGPQNTEDTISGHLSRLT